jgi:thiamine biosynthesis protein ThiS
MDITVNGEEKRFEGPVNVAGLLDALALEPKKIAVERNREIVPKSRYGETALADGDKIEIVQFVGGG